MPLKFTTLARLLLLLPTLAAASAFATSFRVTVAPVEQARVAQIIEFELPADATPPFVLRDAAGSEVALQVEANRGTFVIPVLPAGQAQLFMFESGAAVATTTNAVTTEVTPQHLDLSVRGTHVISYQLDEDNLPRDNIHPNYKRAGYIHPIISPAGAVVSGDYPPNHIHHHGIWSPWTRTRFQGRTPDFWNMNDRTGTVELVAVDATWSGPVHAGFVSRHHMVDLSAPSPVVALNEMWTTTLYDTTGTPRPAYMFDVAMEQTAATPDPLELLEYRYGGLGYRGPQEWDGVPNTFWLTSEGKTDRLKAHATRARWCHVSGLVDGKRTGVAILDHPSNFRHPQPMRVSPNEAFFCYTPPQLGDFSIAAGAPYVARYRFVVMDGAPDADLLDQYWNAFASQPAVTVEAIRD